MATATRKLSRNRKQSRNKRNSGGGSGRIVGLLLAALLIGGGAYAYLNPDIIEQAKELVGLADPAAEESAGAGSAAPQAPAAPLITDAQAVEALNMAKVWVETRLAKGTRLNEINEAIDVPSGQKAFWQSITLSQGAITAIPAGGSAERAVLLLPMQDQGKLIWACAGDIPPVLESSICSQ
ncbi:hypothetical protein H9Q10_08200 [Eikenella sp. S3360]|uniref:Uncharacterized protein n=1 Tax=Eikenella glucosivorans TaxID=2766967 RepID=A0ABS0NBF2_9NEIS|nr:hypothetical protein [Eikenella glucosivorans]MBH5329646.1 hypothetical protein [Eikenella glucosivorans]